ncbi:MAG: HAD hydrolase-like protein [archaeon]|nr:HAD hydrolase-like protein [archaeon]
MSKLVIFDMDGTICDSWAGMSFCYRRTLDKFGRADIADEEYYSCFSGCLPENLSKMLNVEGGELEEAVKYFRECYESEERCKAMLFPYILDIIVNLHNEGYKIGLATMTLEKYAIDTLSHAGIVEYFDVIKGSDEKMRISKTDMINACMEETGISKEDTVMVGDGFSDRSAAQNTGIGFIAAAYGYGITLDNCREYGIENAASPRLVYDAIKKHWDRSVNIQ